jgi:hypothetical protein
MTKNLLSSLVAPQEEIVSSNLGVVARQTHADTVQAVLITTTEGQEVGLFSQVVKDTNWYWIWHFDEEDHEVHPFGMILRTDTYKAIGHAQVSSAGALKLLLREGFTSAELVLDEDAEEELLDDPFFTNDDVAKNDPPQITCGTSAPMFHHTPVKWILWRLGFAT